jgi:imidazolonepropionase-like amidohydrolase
MLGRCKYTNTPAGPPPKFYARTHSDRYVPGTEPLWLQNAKLWTGGRNGTEVIYGDILLDKGLIQTVGYIPPRLLGHPDLKIVDAKGAWVTPGLVDLHSHIGVGSAPELRGGTCISILYMN